MANAVPTIVAHLKNHLQTGKRPILNRGSVSMKTDAIANTLLLIYHIAQSMS